MHVYNSTFIYVLDVLKKQNFGHDTHILHKKVRIMWIFYKNVLLQTLKNVLRQFWSRFVHQIQDY